MIYITQLIYLKEGKEDIFHEYENYVIPVLAKYNGELMLRFRPDGSEFIEANVAKPYEIHLIKFDNQKDFDSFLNDEEREKYLDLKDESIKETFLIKGKKI